MIAKVIAMEKKVLQTYLYDFYGELLTEHQKSIYEDFVLQDLSLGEIAEERGISRQGVHDLVKRCDRLLTGYEDKLHLLERFWSIREKLEQIARLIPQEGCACKGAEQISANRENDHAEQVSAGSENDSAAQAGSSGKRAYERREASFQEIRQLLDEILKEL